MPVQYGDGGLSYAEVRGAPRDVHTRKFRKMNITKNEAQVLRSIICQETATRRTIADLNSMSLVLVSSTLAGLEEKGCITKTTLPGNSGGGRPTFAYNLVENLGCGVGMAIEPDRFHIVVINAKKETVFDESYPLILSDDPEQHLEAIVEQVMERLASVASRSVPAETNFCTIGVTLPGVTDADQGIWLQGYQVTGISHVNMLKVFADKLDTPVYIEDPSRAVTFYEQKKGIGRDIDNFVALYLGYGVGAGVVIDSKIYRGSNGLAGEVGHIVVDPGGSRCSCGDVGCLETVASSGAIMRRIKDRLDEGVVSTVYRPEEDKSGGAALRAVLEAAEKKDRLARSMLYETGEFIGSAGAILIKLFNPKRLIVTGPGSIFHNYFRPRVEMMFERRVMPEMLSGFELHFADYEENHEAIGVALMSLEHYWDGLLRKISETSVKQIEMKQKAF